ncbi:hypothetical protein AgCh_000537 [Apium graveolens]
MKGFKCVSPFFVESFNKGELPLPDEFVGEFGKGLAQTLYLRVKNCDTWRCYYDADNACITNIFDENTVEIDYPLRPVNYHRNVIDQQNRVVFSPMDLEKMAAKFLYNAMGISQYSHTLHINKQLLEEATKTLVFSEDSIRQLGLRKEMTWIQFSMNKYKWVLNLKWEDGFLFFNREWNKLCVDVNLREDVVCVIPRTSETQRFTICIIPKEDRIETQKEEKALLGDFNSEDDEGNEQLQYLNTSPWKRKLDMPFESLRNTDLKNGEGKLKPTTKEAPTLELKPLLQHLRYAFLGNEDKLLRILREFKSAIGWTIVDIKGISPSYCMHKILLEEGSKPTVEQQRKLNPIMKEVVKKENLEWLDAGIIYLISDSSWVSPMQCVPKKGGITVVANEKNELIPT